MENKRLFYIVVPVYKTEKYLMDCCLSVKNQTYSNWILILVDDGSPDKSGQICDELAKMIIVFMSFIKKIKDW